MSRPLLAILTLMRKQDLRPIVRGLVRYRRLPFRGNVRQFASLIREAERRGQQAYVLAWDGKSQPSRLAGFVLKQGGWHREAFTWPRVIYNRIPDRKVEHTSAYGKLLEDLNIHGCRIFNERFIDKKELYLRLQHGKMGSWLPETAVYSPEHMYDMLKRHGAVFLKESQSSRGRGVCEVRLLKKGLARIRGSIVRKDGRERNINRVVKASQIDRYVGRKYRSDYICQQAVMLPVYHGGKFDLRTLLQKDGSGVWRWTGWGARLASRGQATTHVPRGGRVENVDSLMESVFGKSRSAVLIRDLRSSLGELALAVESAVRMNMGEMSMDLVVDRQGKFWLLEANSKPMKFDETAIRRLARQRLLDYCGYLSSGSN